jgi:hypothetical protein
MKALAPLPRMSNDPYPPFKVADADLQSLTAEKPFPPWSETSGVWAPRKPYTGNEIAKQYEAVEKTWANPGWGTGDDGQSGFVKMWATAFGWDSGLMSSVAAIPKRLSKQFNNLYIAAPMLTI